MQNKILHDRLGALHIQLAERDRTSAGISVDDDAGLQNVINYLRRSKEIVSVSQSLTHQSVQPHHFLTQLRGLSCTGGNRDLFVKTGKVALTITSK